MARFGNAQRPSGSNRTSNLAALAVIVLIGVWITWAQLNRRAERRAEEAQQLEQQQQERQRKAARPRLPARPIGESLPKAAGAHGPAACGLALDLGDAGAGNDEFGEVVPVAPWAVGTSNPASAIAIVLNRPGLSNTVRFTLGENHFELPRGAVGVRVSVKWTAGDPMVQPDATDLLVRLTSGGQPLGANHALHALLPLSMSFTDYGGPVDSWGAGSSIPAAIVNATDFGVDIAIKSGSPICSVNIAAVEITVYESQDANLR